MYVEELEEHMKALREERAQSAAESRKVRAASFAFLLNDSFQVADRAEDICADKQLTVSAYVCEDLYVTLLAMAC